MLIHACTLKHEYPFPLTQYDWGKATGYSIRIHALGLWINRSEGKIKSNTPSNSHVTRKISGAYG